MLFNRQGLRQPREYAHPYLSGNFAPVQTARPLTPCSYTGSIPRELAGGQYVRNGGNPLTNEDLGREAHWFDGDGMLSGVLFRYKGEKGSLAIQPEFVNKYILTDVFLHSRSNRLLKTPILPSIATLVNPLNSLFTITSTVARTLLLVLLSHLPGSQRAVKRISVANTGIIYHDGRALATCESGPPIRVQLPSLETVGWFDGRRAENEPSRDDRPGYGGDGPLSFMQEWTTGHPRVDRSTGELISFHSSFSAPYVHYSIVPPSRSEKLTHSSSPRLNIPIPGISGAKMMHDFGVSVSHTVIMDLPLSLDPLNLARNKPVVAYDPTQKARFGVFPRYSPSSIRWFETNPCCIFHTANCWSTADSTAASPVPSMTVHLLACRLTSASVVYSAGDLTSPAPTSPIPPEFAEEEQCRLYYYAFDLSSPPTSLAPSYQWALSSLAFEFPSISPLTAMHSARYVYGCSNSAATFSAALGRAVKIDYLAKMDVDTLIARGKAEPPEDIKGCVDTRSIEEVLASTDPRDPIKLFQLPKGYYAQEPTFVPREEQASEDDGWLLFYVFDEGQLEADGEAAPTAQSELWVLNATDMKSVVAKVRLPQRVPYGLHGNWFSEDEVEGQREVLGFRRVIDEDTEVVEEQGMLGGVWTGVRERILKSIG